LIVLRDLLSKQNAYLHHKEITQNETTKIFEFEKERVQFEMKI